MKSRAIFLIFSLYTFASIGSALAQDERARVATQLNEYIRAFHNFDSEGVIRHYHQPLMIVAGPRVRLLATPSDIEAWMNGLWANMKKREFYRGSDFSPLHIKQLSPTVMIASAQYIRHYKSGGPEQEPGGVTYLLHKEADIWKIAVVTGHPPGNLIKLE